MYTCPVPSGQESAKWSVTPEQTVAELEALKVAVAFRDGELRLSQLSGSSGNLKLRSLLVDEDL